MSSPLARGLRVAMRAAGKRVAAARGIHFTACRYYNIAGDCFNYAVYEQPLKPPPLAELVDWPRSPDAYPVVRGYSHVVVCCANGAIYQVGL